MLSGTTPSASAIVGTAVLRIVVSSASIRKATATIQGSRRLTEGSSTSGLALPPPDSLDRPVAVVVDALAVDLVLALGLLAQLRLGRLQHRVLEEDLALGEAGRGDAARLGNGFLLLRAQR